MTVVYSTVDRKPAQVRWLILAHPFNMDGRAASHTITDKIPHLLAAGIELVVISGVTGEHDDRFEHHQVWSWGPSGFKFEMRHVLRQKIHSRHLYRLCMLIISLALLPFILIERILKNVESSWSWQFSAVHRGLKLARHKKFDLIYSTAGPFAAHLAAQKLKKKLGTPWLAEIHDPLVMPGSHPNNRRQKAYADVERRICDDADIAIWFTDQAMQSALRRNPQLGGRGRVMLPGVDNPFHGTVPTYIRKDKFILGHFGSLSEKRTFLPFIHALSILKQNQPETYRDVEIHIFGGNLDSSSIESAKGLGVMDKIVLHGRLENDTAIGISGRDQVLMHMRTCDALALVHGEDPMCAEYIPSKLYEYLWMQRPILATVHDNPQMAQLLKEFGHSPVESSLQNGGKSTNASEKISKKIISLWDSWTDSKLYDNEIISNYTTKQSVHNMMQWVDDLANAKCPSELNDSVNRIDELTIAICCRDNAEYLSFLFKILGKVEKKYNIKYKYIFLENDSKDQTVNMIKRFLKQRNGELIHPNSASNFKFEKRTEKMARLRNQIKQLLSTTETWTIIIDTDIYFDESIIEILFSHLALNANIGMICANGLEAIKFEGTRKYRSKYKLFKHEIELDNNKLLTQFHYYDTYAYRDQNSKYLWPNCNYFYCEKCTKHQKIDSIQNLEYTNSAFGGIALISSKIMKDENIVWSGFDASGTEQCEHVSLCEKILKIKKMKIAIARNAYCYWIVP